MFGGKTSMYTVVMDDLRGEKEGSEWRVFRGREGRRRVYGGRLKTKKKKR